MSKSVKKNSSDYKGGTWIRGYLGRVIAYVETNSITIVGGAIMAFLIASAGYVYGNVTAIGNLPGVVSALTEEVTILKEELLTQKQENTSLFNTISLQLQTQGTTLSSIQTQLGGLQNVTQQLLEAALKSN